MSLFLGPIHHRLYHKTRPQGELVTTLAEREGARGGGSGKYETYVNCRPRPFEELIDTDNIHGWPRAYIHDAESRYAALVAAILKEDSGVKSWIEDEALAFGVSNAAPVEASLTGVHCFYGDNLVNGMPCDYVDRATEQAEDHIAWILDRDLRGDFWIRASRSPELYYALRLVEMCGMLSDTRLELLSPSEMSYVSKEKA